MKTPEDFYNLEKVAKDTLDRVESCKPLFEIMVPQDGQWWTIHLKVFHNADGEYYVENVWSTSEEEL